MVGDREVVAVAKESLGTMCFPDGRKEGIATFFTVLRDEREVTIVRGVDGTISVCTKSWLLQNDWKLVESIVPYTHATFVMMLEAMMMAADYFGLDLKTEIEKLHASDGKIQFEYGGNGVPSFVPQQSESGGCD